MLGTSSNAIMTVQIQEDFAAQLPSQNSPSLLPTKSEPFLTIPILRRNERCCWWKCLLLVGPGSGPLHSEVRLCHEKGEG